MKKVILATLLLFTAVYAKQVPQESYSVYPQKEQSLKANYIHAEGEHTLIGKSPDGIIEFDSECQFKALEGVDHIMHHWDFYDRMTFTPNSDFFGGSEYYVTNLTKNESVKANIWRGPNIDNSATDCLERIDEYKEEIILVNDLGTKTRWKIHSDDFRDLLTHWKKGASVIIGKNNKGWLSSYFSDCKHILVSYRATKHNLYVRATPMPL